MEYKAKIYKEKAAKIIKELKKRNMEGMYCGNSQLAVDEILNMIPDGALVGLGGSESIIESGPCRGFEKKGHPPAGSLQRGSHQGRG